MSARTANAVSRLTLWGVGHDHEKKRLDEKVTEKKGNEGSFSTAPLFLFFEENK